MLVRRSRLRQALSIVLAALLCFFFPGELAATELGRFWLMAMAVFWLPRALIQPVFFGLRHPLSATLFAVFLLGAVLHAASFNL